MSKKIDLMEHVKKTAEEYRIKCIENREEWKLRLNLFSDGGKSKNGVLPIENHYVDLSPGERGRV